MKNITITGRDIIEYDGRDHTGALKELGIEYISRTDGCFDSKIGDLIFQVDLDFVLRHALLDEQIYNKYYKKSEEYKKYYNEGRDAYLAGQEEDSPYDTGTTADKDYWTTSVYHKRHPWYDGYRETETKTAEDKYQIKQMNEELKAVVAKYGLQIEYEDEYGYAYGKTPEGYDFRFLE